jgi:hypothetical protein
MGTAPLFSLHSSRFARLACGAFYAAVVLGSFFDLYEFVGDNLFIRGGRTKIVNDYLLKKGTAIRRRLAVSNKEQKG